MPTNGSENDWIEYIGVIKSDSRWTSGRNQAERLLLGWQVHRTAMKMLRTEIWRKYPLLKRPAWDTVKETLAFMDETMGCVDMHEGVNVKPGEDEEGLEKEKGDKFKAGLKDSEQ